jgi:hypothetical protein
MLLAFRKMLECIYLMQCTDTYCGIFPVSLCSLIKHIVTSAKEWMSIHRKYDKESFKQPYINSGFSAKWVCTKLRANFSVQLTFIMKSEVLQFSSHCFHLLFIFLPLLICWEGLTVTERENVMIQLPLLSEASSLMVIRKLSIGGNLLLHSITVYSPDE